MLCIIYQNKEWSETNNLQTKQTSIKMARTIDTSKLPPYRPKEYMPHHHKDLAYKLALLGCCDEEIASVFGITDEAFRQWKNQYPDFLGVLLDGRDIADANVSVSLYKRACGFTKEAVKIFYDSKTGEEVLVPYDEYYPPDTKAATMWLKNRRRQTKHADSMKWTDNNQTELTGPNGMPLYPDQTEKAKQNREILLKEIADE